MKILFASGNLNKLKEVREIFKGNKHLEIIGMNDLGIDVDVVEDRPTLEGNAKKKAKEIYEVAQMPVISEDFGLFVDALPGKLGVYSKRYCQGTDQDRNNKLLSELTGIPVEKRTARYKSVFCFYDGVQTILAEGVTEGVITDSERGNNGFAYDTLMEVGNKTLAEMTNEEKNEISSRKRGLENLCKEIIVPLTPGEISQEHKHCVFVSIFCRDSKPYINYPHVENKEVIIPLVLMQERWDGSRGFAGGMVDKEDYVDGQVSLEVLKNALIREMIEEIGMKEEWINIQGLKPLCTFAKGNNYIHNFSYEVTEDMFDNIFKNSVNATHIKSENNGSIICHVAKYKGGKGYDMFLKNQFCATAKLELMNLVETEHLLKDYSK